MLQKKNIYRLILSLHSSVVKLYGIDLTKSDCGEDIKSNVTLKGFFIFLLQHAWPHTSV